MAGKDQSPNVSPNVHKQHQTVYKKWKRTGNSNASYWNIQSGHRNEIWHRKMCNACNEKHQTTPNGLNGTTKSRQD